MKEKADKNKRKTESIKDTSNKRQKCKVNICSTHGTHPWSECSLNPRSKKYLKNPTSPFLRRDSRRDNRYSRDQYKNSNPRGGPQGDKRGNSNYQSNRQLQ